MSAGNPLQIQTTNGPILGFVDTHSLSSPPYTSSRASGPSAGVQKWLGIPYSLTPRFQRPTAPAPWTEVKECFEFPDMFYQPPSSLEGLFGVVEGAVRRDQVGVTEVGGGINVFKPILEEGDSAELPVLVWIYGGSLNNGNSSTYLYDPTEWIRRGTSLTPGGANQKFIVVTLEYRTNIFGFYASPETAARDPKGLAGNYGLYDCVAALEWVQSNIKSFGGNPENVTVFGESAGAFVISNLLVSGKKLFKKAIMESGSCGTMQTRSASASYPSLSHLSSTLLASDPSLSTPAAQHDHLLSLTPAALLKLHIDHYKWGGVSLTLEPEGGVWTEATQKRLERGEWDSWIEGVLVGSNEDEGTMFAVAMQLSTPAAYSAYLAASFPPTLIPTLLAKYPFHEPRSPALSPPDDILRNPASLLLRDQLFVNPAWDLCVALSGGNSGGKGMGEGKGVWMYRCREVVERLSKGGRADLGSMHIIEIPLVFNTSSLWKEGSHEALSSVAFGDRWVRFAATGNPDPEWKPFTPETPTWLAFGTGGKAENEDLTEFEQNMVQFGVRK